MFTSPADNNFYKFPWFEEDSLSKLCLLRHWESLKIAFYWPLFSIFVVLTVNLKSVQCLTLPMTDSNRKPLVSKAIALPTEPQP